MNRNAHNRCRDGENCTGPGCRVTTGKTRRKNNERRPKINKHEGTHESRSGK